MYLCIYEGDEGYECSILWDTLSPFAHPSCRNCVHTKNHYLIRNHMQALFSELFFSKTYFPKKVSEFSFFSDFFHSFLIFRLICCKNFIYSSKTKAFISKISAFFAIFFSSKTNKFFTRTTIYCICNNMPYAIYAVNSYLKIV